MSQIWHKLKFPHKHINQWIVLSHCWPSYSGDDKEIVTCTKCANCDWKRWSLNVIQWTNILCSCYIHWLCSCWIFCVTSSDIEHTGCFWCTITLQTQVVVKQVYTDVLRCSVYITCLKNIVNVNCKEMYIFVSADDPLAVQCKNYVTSNDIFSMTCST